MILAMLTQRWTGFSILPRKKPTGSMVQGPFTTTSWRVSSLRIQQPHSMSPWNLTLQISHQITWLRPIISPTSQLSCGTTLMPFLATIVTSMGVCWRDGQSSDCSSTQSHLHPSSLLPSQQVQAFPPSTEYLYGKCDAVLVHYTPPLGIPSKHPAC